MLTLKIFQSVVGCLYFFGIGCLKLSASKRSACAKQPGVSLELFIFFSWRSSELSANYFLWSLVSWVSFSFSYSNFLFIKFWPSLTLSTVFLILLYCCPYLLISGLEHQSWLGVFSAFVWLFYLRYLPWSFIFIFHSFFDEMYLLKTFFNCTIWYILYIFSAFDLHIYFDLIHHFNTCVRGHF